MKFLTTEQMAKHTLKVIEDAVEKEYIAGETCYRPEPSKCYYSPCGKIGKCVKDIPDYDPREPIETYNIKEINEAFDREYDKYKNSPEYKKHIKDMGEKDFVKIKMPTYYIAKHSDEDLRAAVLAEREACAQLCESIAKPEENIYYTAPLIDIAIAAIRGRTE